MTALDTLPKTGLDKAIEAAGGVPEVAEKIGSSPTGASVVAACR